MKLRSFLCGVLAAALICALVFTAMAAPTSRQIEVFPITIEVDGSTFEPTDVNGNPVEVFAYNGTTYAPLRALAEAYGLEVGYNAEKNLATVNKPAAADQPATPPVDTTQGTRSNPYPADAGATVPYNEYSFEPTRQIQVTCTKIFRGDAAALIAYTPSQISSDQEMIVMEMDVKYISSTDGEDDVLKGSDIIYEDTFYTADGGSIMTNLITVRGDSGKSGVFDAKFYPGGSGKVYYPSVVNKSVTDILLKVPAEAGKKNSWIKCNSDSNVISDVKEAKSYLGMVDEDNKANSPVKITLRNSLPTTLSEYDRDDNRIASASITAFDYKVDGSRVTITFTGEKTYDKEGSGQSRAVKVGWKLYDSEGYVVDDGTARSTSIKMGEKFKNCTDTIYNVEPGEYELEIMSVN